MKNVRERMRKRRSKKAHEVHNQHEPFSPSTRGRLDKVPHGRRRGKRWEPEGLTNK